jgi:hypothetical protein
MWLQPVLRIRDVLSRIRIKTFFLSRILDPTWKVKYKLTFSSHAFRNKVLVIVKKIRDLEKNSSRIPDPWAKKHRIQDPDPQHWLQLKEDKWLTQEQLPVPFDGLAP